MTEDELERLNRAADNFDAALAAATAQVLAQFRADVAPEVIAFLQDRTSLYAGRTAELIGAFTAATVEHLKPCSPAHPARSFRSCLTCRSTTRTTPTTTPRTN